MDQAAFKRQPIQTGRSQHKKIFGVQKQPIGDEPCGEVPHCYFHKENLITKFCQRKQCTLPLCDICQEIHISEHNKQMTHSEINTYAIVREKALHQLSVYLRRCKHGRDSVMSVLFAQKNQIEQTVNAFFEDLVTKLESMTITEEQIMELQRRQEKIAKGSAKALIQHCADTYPDFKYPKLNITFNAGTLLTTLHNFTSIVVQQPQQRPPPNHGGQHIAHHVHGGMMPIMTTSVNVIPENPPPPVIHQVIAARPLERPIELSKKLDYSPKPLTVVKPFAQIEASMHSPAPIHLHSSQQSFSPIVIHPSQNKVELVSPIQKLAETNQKSVSIQKHVRNTLPLERKENIDVNRGFQDVHLEPSRSQPYFKGTIGTTVHTGTTIQSNSNQIRRSDQNIVSFRPHSIHKTESLESKDWRAVIDTIPMVKQTGTSHTQLTKVTEQKQSFTTKILSPQQIKAMLGRKNNLMGEQNSKTSRTKTVEKRVQYLHHDLPHFKVLGNDIELKQSYYDQSLVVREPAHNEYFQISSGSYSPQFRHLQMQGERHNVNEPEIKIYKPIESTIHNQLQKQQETMNRPPPYEFRYVPHNYKSHQPWTHESHVTHLQVPRVQ